MGLNISHDTWDGAYSAFMRFRTELAKYAGLPPLELMEGYYSDDDYLFKKIENSFTPGEIGLASFIKMKEQFPIKWECLKKRPLLTLLLHSDCEGYINWSECKPLADDLKKVLEAIPADLDCGGHIGNLREKTQTFIDGCMAAYEAKEKLEFH